MTIATKVTLADLGLEPSKRGTRSFTPRRAHRLGPTVNLAEAGRLPELRLRRG
jgi:hypothetical protein